MDSENQTPADDHAQALAEKTAFLSSPANWPGLQGEIAVVQTHISFVVLAGDFVYKLKKPVSCEFVDFSSLEARKFHCDEELRLNRRLSRGIYLDVIALVRRDDGSLALGGPGEVVDWVVKMKRLPAEQMLDRAIRDGTVQLSDLDAVSETLGRFFANSLPVAIPPAEYRRRFADAVTRQRRTLMEPRYGLPAESVERVVGVLRKTLMGNAPLFDQRVRRAHVREGHGDLRADHICLGPPVAVIDCIEFDRDMRIQDTADELALLSVECAYHGSPGAGRHLLEGCCSRLGDRPPPTLIAFYQAFRSLMQARLAVMHLDNAAVVDPGAWQRRAVDYLRLAEGYARPIG